MADDSMLARFREMRGKKGGKDDKGTEPGGEPGEKGGSASAPTFGDLKTAADRIDAIVGGGEMDDGLPGGEAGASGGESAGDDASILAEAAGVSPEEARKLLDAAKKLPEVAGLDAKALGERLKEDFDLRMRLEELAARPSRVESAGPTPIGGASAGPPAGMPPMGGPGGM